MQISARARLISLIIALVFMSATLIGGGTYLIINHLNNAKATTETEYIMTTNLFNTDGTINGVAARTLLEVVGYWNNQNDTGEYKAHQIRSRTSSAGTDTSSNPDATIIFPMGYVNDTNGDSIYWQATYLCDNYLTIWMVKSYTTSKWNNSNVDVNYGTYANSTIQSYLDGTLWDVLTQSSSELQSIFALPSTVGYQKLGDEGLSSSNSDTQYWYFYYAATDYFSEFDNLASSVYSGSYLWLPSWSEVGNNTSSEYTNSTSSYTGQWGLNSTDRSLNTSNYDGTSANYYWLRSGSNSSNTDAMEMKYDGSASSADVSGRNSVRPACHISLDTLSQYAEITIAVESSNLAYGTVSGGGKYDLDYVGTTTITATPNYGYVFDYWEDSAGNKFYSNPYTFPIIQSETYTAYFRPVNVIVTSVNNGAEIAANGCEVTSQKYTFTLDFTANNYILSATINSTIVQPITATNGSFITDDSCIAINYNTNTSGSRMYLEIIGVVDDITITLQFTNSAQSLTPASGGANIDGVALQVSASGTNTSLAAVGEARITGYTQTDGLATVHVSAMASGGFYFVGWQVDGETISTLLSADIPYSDVEGKILIAVFAPIDNANNIDGTTDNGYTDDIV